MRQFTTKIAFAMALTVLLIGASAATLYDNLSAPSNGVTPPSAFGLDPIYDLFSNGNSSNFFLRNINLLLSGNPTDGGSFNVSLYRDSGATPGGVVVNFGNISDSILSTSLNVVSIPFAPYPLLPNMRYWVGISSAYSVSWSWSLDISGLGVAGEYFSATGNVFPNIDGPWQMSVTDNTTPLPAALPLFATGLGALGLLGWRRKRKALAA